MYTAKQKKNQQCLFIYIYIYIYYLDESKDLQYFGNIRYNSVVLDAFAEVIKMINHTGLWDAELAWYPPSATCRISSMVWSILIEYTVIRLLELPWSSRFCHLSWLSGCSTVINFTFTFRAANIFRYFLSVVTWFELISITLQIGLSYTFICAAFKSHSERSNAERSNAERASALTYTILPTTAGTYHGFNCIDHVIY